MFEGRKIAAVLLMGGEGRRFGSSMPKQFHLLGGKPIFLYALETFLKWGFFDEIVLVCHPDWIEAAEQFKGIRVVKGGSTRQQSSYLGLKSLSESIEIVLVHDGVRPFVSQEIIEANIAGAMKHGAVDTCIRSADTLVYAPEGDRIQEIPRRESYLRGQTPQTFRKDWLLEAHENAMKEGIENASDDCRLVLKNGHRIGVVPGDEKNLKITSEFDLWMAQWLLAQDRAGAEEPAPASLKD